MGQEATTPKATDEEGKYDVSSSSIIIIIVVIMIIHSSTEILSGSSSTGSTEIPATPLADDKNESNIGEIEATDSKEGADPTKEENKEAKQFF